MPSKHPETAPNSSTPRDPLHILFIHHSCGGQLLADAGADIEVSKCIYDRHRNGGGLRALLQEQGHEIHEASYGSEIGEDTDLFDWLPKFRGKMDKILKVDGNDRFFDDERKNRVVMFKSCYPNNRFIGEGAAPGNPKGPELTVWNAKATMTALLDVFKKHSDTLFIYLTAPPMAPVFEPLWKQLAKTALRKPRAMKLRTDQATLARKFNTWVVGNDGWLSDYPMKNVAVFDYYDILTDGGADNLSRFPSGDGSDSHPSRLGNEKAAAMFVPFLNEAVRLAGLV